MAEHDCLWRPSAVLSSSAQQSARLWIAHVKPAVRIEMAGEQLGVVITFNKDEIRVNEMFQQTVPAVEIRRDHHFAVPVLDYESVRRIPRIVRHFECLEAEVAYLEAAIGEGPQFE